MADNEPTLESVQAELAKAQARIKELNDESKGHRLNADIFRKQAEEKTAAADAAKADADKRVQEADAKAKERSEAARLRSIRADLRVAAKDAGARDAADVLALIDMAQVQSSDDGDVANASDLIEALKKTKPYLFGEATSSSTAKPPPQTPPAGKKATEMTAEEAQAAVRDLGAKNFRF